MSCDEDKRTLALIQTMKLEKLRTEWRRRYGVPPALRSEPFLRMLLAWRIQADSHGGLDEVTRRALAKKGSPRAEGLELGHGTRLARNWKGKRIEVVVEENGFLWEGKVYSSLSSAASAIAGTKWNGPRFFGLRDRQ